MIYIYLPRHLKPGEITKTLQCNPRGQHLSFNSHSLKELQSRNQNFITNLQPFWPNSYKLQNKARPTPQNNLSLNANPALPEFKKQKSNNLDPTPPKYLPPSQHQDTQVKEAAKISNIVKHVGKYS